MTRLASFQLDLMTTIRRSVPMLFAFGVACGGDSGTNPVQPPPAPPPPLTIAVQASIVVGQIVEATASSAGTATSWSSSNPAVAAVSGEGSVTGVGVGVDTIKAVSGASSGAAVITVGPALVLPTGTTLLNLKVGYAATITPGTATRGWAIPVGGEYVVIAANTNPQPDVFAQFAVRVDSTPSLLSSSVRISQSVVPRVDTTSTEARLRAYERTFEPFGKSAFAEIQAHRAHQGSLRFNSITSDVRIGDRAAFQYYNFVARTSTVVNAVVVMVSPHAVMFADTASPAGGFTTADYQLFANEFESVTYPTDTTYFGKPSDVDGNGRVIMLFTPEVNKLTPKGTGGYYGGFFSAADLYPTSSNALSNAGEIFYIAVPDPSNQFGIQLTADVLRTGTRTTIAHEFQHMINAGNRLALGSAFTGFEDSWLDEGLAHMAEDVVGRAVLKVGAFQRMTLQGVRAPSFDDYNAFFFQNLGRFGDWARSPNAYGANSFLGTASSAQRGAIWSLVRRTADFHSGGNLSAFARALTSGKSHGVANISAAAGASWDALVVEWLVANVADGLIGPGGGPNGYASYDIHSVGVAGKPVDPYPLAITPSALGLNVGSVVSGSGSYYSIQAASAKYVTLTTSDGTAAADYPGARMIVVRVK